jgi:hypothetical protein
MEVEMHQSRFTTSAASWFLALATASSSSIADDSKDDRTAMQPQQILDDCVQAVQAGDFHRYVGHLSEQEQVAQAGFVLFITSTMSPSPDDYEPEVFLLTRALNDLVKQYAIPESQRSPEQQAAEEARKGMLGQAFRAAIAPPGVSHLYNPNSNSSGIRETCIKSAGILRDPQRFLVAALTETARPTHISGEETKKCKTSIDFGGMAKAYGQAEWTLYTRGNYALAIASAPRADARTVPQFPARNAVNGVPAGVVASPSVGSLPTSLRIVFRRIEGVWKIDRLLPPTVLMPTVSTSPPQANLLPAQIYPGDPRSVPLPDTSSQPSSTAPGLR